jgi:hypothetical protein
LNNEFDGCSPLEIMSYFGNNPQQQTSGFISGRARGFVLKKLLPAALERKIIPVCRVSFGKGVRAGFL